MATKHLMGRPFRLNMADLLFRIGTLDEVALSTRTRGLKPNSVSKTESAALSGATRRLEVHKCLLWLAKRKTPIVARSVRCVGLATLPGAGLMNGG